MVSAAAVEEHQGQALEKPVVPGLCPQTEKTQGKVLDKAETDNFSKIFCCSKLTKHSLSVSSQPLLSGSQLSQPVCM